MTTVLVVDDSAMDRRLAGGLVQKNTDFSVLYAIDGDDALEQIESHLPDLVITDLQMPRKNGLEALKDIKAHPRLRLIPVVALSTSSAEEDIRAAYDLGINAYVKKPVGFVLFAEAMEAVYNFWFKLAKRAVEET